MFNLTFDILDKSLCSLAKSHSSIEHDLVIRREFDDVIHALNLLKHVCGDYDSMKYPDEYFQGKRYPEGFDEERSVNR